MSVQKKINKMIFLSLLIMGITTSIMAEENREIVGRNNVHYDHSREFNSVDDQTLRQRRDNRSNSPQYDYNREFNDAGNQTLRQRRGNRRNSPKHHHNREFSGAGNQTLKQRRNNEGFMTDKFSRRSLDTLSDRENQILSNRAFSGKISESDYSGGCDWCDWVDEPNNKSSLNKEEIKGLLQMREEEKLARDIYRKLGEKWNIRIFYNISSSEQTHMDAVKTLLDYYEIDDPVKNNTYGQFTSEAISKLYESLLEQGYSSVIEALKVGAIVEDLDIFDLNQFTSETENKNLIRLYDNLNSASRNHLRAFTRQIERYGDEYIPQHISKKEYDVIISK